jgi:LysM repeat protein
MRLSRTVFLILLNATAASAQKTAKTTPDKPTQTGTISTCNKWYDVVSGDSCGTVEQAFGITHAQFIAWNPAVSQDCTQNFWVSEAYCVGVGAGQPVSTTSKLATGLPSPDKPTQTGIASNCNLWYDVVSGDTCTTVEQKFGITHAQFIAWNPAVSSDCSVNFWIGNSYCVGTGKVVSTVSTTTRTSQSSISIITPSGTYSALPDRSTTASVSSTDDSWPPTATQSGIAPNCELPSNTT